MDFLDPAKKRSHNRRLFIGYILVAIAIAMASLILLLQSFGYDVDRKTGKVIQNGLVYFSAKPVGADVYINGERKGTTDLRIALPEGDYSIELRRQGYISWKKDLRLEGGSIEQLVYPYLFVEKQVTIDEQLYAKPPNFASQSPDRRWLLIQPAGELSTFELFDTSTTATTLRQIELPEGLLASASGGHKIRPVEWSRNNRHLLLKHTYSAKTEFIILDTVTPARSVNLNSTFNLTPSSVSLSDKVYDRYYFYNATEQTVSDALLSSGRASVILRGVIDMKVYKNDILYVTSTGAPEGKHLVQIYNDGKSYLVKDIDIAKKYLLARASYAGTDYVVVGSSAAEDILIYKNTLSLAKNGKQPVASIALRLGSAAFLSFSEDSRFISAQNGSKFAVYDIESARRYYFASKHKISSGYEASWMDNHRLTTVSAGQTIIFDFDGTNTNVLTKSVDAFKVFFDPRYERLYNIAPSKVVPKRLALTSTSLRSN